jgi:hypothetical protein
MRKIILTIIAAAGLIAAGAAITFAATSSSSVIHACVNKTHVLSLRTGTSCPSGTTGISWNHAGPAGPSTAGPTGLDVRWIPAMTTGTGLVNANARCPASHPYVVGGGVGSLGTVQQSGPSGMMSGHPGWGVTVKISGTASDVYALAACAK